MSALAANRTAGQEARIAEIIAYANTTSCRHGFISRYFGGRPIEQCQSCDNCLGMGSASPGASPQRGATLGAADLDTATAAILQGVAELPVPLGRTGLARALQGAATSPVKPERFPLFGALSSRSQRGIAKQVAELEGRGLLEPYRKRGYRLLRLTGEGERWMQRYRRNDPASGRRSPPPPDVPRANDAAVHRSDFDQALFEQLKSWRLEQAREKDLPAFCIFHNSVLKRIVAECPSTPDELLSIRGIGPRKLEQFGPVILELIASHIAAGSGRTEPASEA